MLITTYALRDRDLETLLAEGTPAPRLIGRNAYRGPASIYSCNRRGDVWAPSRRGYTDPATRSCIQRRRPHLRALSRIVRRHRWKGGRFTVRPTGLWIWDEERGELEQIAEFVILITERRRPPSAVRKPTRSRARESKTRPYEPAYPIAEGAGVRLCTFCFSADLDATGCRTCKRGNGGYGLKW